MQSNVTRPRNGIALDTSGYGDSKQCYKTPFLVWIVFHPMPFQSGKNFTQAFIKVVGWYNFKGWDGVFKLF